MILAGDIGGTKTHLALFEAGKKITWVRDKIYLSGDYKSLSEIIKEFLGIDTTKLSAACFGIAGAIINNSCRTTNLPWVIEGKDIASEFNIANVFLINDLSANAYGLRALSPNELFVLNQGKAPGNSNKALISAGTGLGEVGILWDGTKDIPIASEGGHTDFSPRNDLEIDLLRYLQQKFGHVSFERVLSGQGLYNLYSFLMDTDLETESEIIQLALTQDDPAKVITEMALSKKSKACMRALDWFVSLYGSEAGNLALKFLALDCVYIGGGIAPKILSALQNGSFMQSFSEKGRFKSVLELIPVKIVLNENTALLGAAIHAQEHI